MSKKSKEFADALRFVADEIEKAEEVDERSTFQVEAETIAGRLENCLEAFQPVGTGWVKIHGMIRFKKAQE